MMDKERYKSPLPRHLGLLAGGDTTTYRYDAVSGQLTNIAYQSAVATAGVGYRYDRLGRLAEVRDAAGVRTFEYNDAGQVTRETLVSPTGTTNVLTRAYDALGRGAGLQLNGEYGVGYAYDGTGRFGGLSWSNAAQARASATYDYVERSDRLAGYAVTNPATGLRFEATRELESRRDLVSAVSNRVTVSGSNALVSAYRYANDEVGRRTERVDAVAGQAAATNAFGYNRRGELTNAVMSGSQYGFGYDQLGNRTASATNGVASAYTANELNQILQRAQGGVTNRFRYDADGNLTNDGARAYAWDGENRLARVVKAGETKTEYVYDYMGRRCGKKTYQWQAGAWVLTEERTFLYDGWNLIREQAKTVATSAVTTNYYAWGLDLSGSQQGAGGIGGLVSSTRASATATRTLLHAYDANGNLGQSVDASDGSLKASYQYDPYGNVAAQSGDLAGENPFRFSTKYCDDETGMSYYGHRYYAPEVGRWLTRDAIKELGGLNLYAFVANDSVQGFDARGMKRLDEFTGGAFLVTPTDQQVAQDNEWRDVREITSASEIKDYTVSKRTLEDIARKTHTDRRAAGLTVDYLEKIGSGKKCGMVVVLTIYLNDQWWEKDLLEKGDSMTYIPHQKYIDDLGHLRLELVSDVYRAPPRNLGLAHERGHAEDYVDAWPKIKAGLEKLRAEKEVLTQSKMRAALAKLVYETIGQVGADQLKVNRRTLEWFSTNGYKQGESAWEFDRK